MTEIILTSSVLILVIALLRRLLRGRIDPRIQYALWLLAALRLLIPGSLFAAPVSVLGAAEELQTAITAALPKEPDTPLSRDVPVSALPEPAQSHDGAVVTYSPPVSATHVTVQRINWLDVVWKAGAAAVGAALTLSNAAFYCRLRRGRRRIPAEELPFPCRTAVYAARALSSPCLFGLFRPAIYLNEAALNPERLEHILVHEQTHLHHGDHLWAVLRSVCLAIHWYNPLVWWATVLSRRDCELACDAGAIARLGESRRLDYGQTLVSMVTPRVFPADLLRASTTMTAGKRTMTERIKLIAKRPRMLKITLAAVALAVCGMALLTFGGTGKDAPSDSSLPGGTQGTDYVYTHSSGLFSLTLPESWAEDVVFQETEDGVNLFEANTYAQAKYGWLMVVYPQPAAWVEEHVGGNFIPLDSFTRHGVPYQYILEYRLDEDFAHEPAAEPYREQFQALLDQRQAVADGFRLLTASDGAAALDNVQALALYRKAREAWSWFDLGTIPVTGEEMNGYSQVEGFNSLEELRSYLRTLFSQELTEHLLTGYQRFQEKDGHLYAEDASRGSSIYAGEETVTAFLMDNENAAQYGYDCHIFAQTEVLDEDLSTVLYQMRHDWFISWNGKNYVFTSFGPWDDVDPQRYYNALAILDHYNRGNTITTWHPMLRNLDWNALYATRDQCPEGFDLGDYVLSAISQYIADQDNALTAVQYADILSATEGLDGAYAEGFSFIVWELYAQNPRQFAKVVLEDLTEEQRGDVVMFLGSELAYHMGQGESLPVQEVLDRLEMTLAGEPVPVVPSEVWKYLLGPGESFRLLPVGVQRGYTAVYATSAPAVAAVDSDTGAVTAVSPGTAEISLHVECSAGQFDFTCTVVCQWEA